MKILIIDDSPITRAMLGEFAESAGHEVAGEAETAEQGLARYRELKPDMVFLDLSLMEGDGLSTLRNIKEEDPEARVLIISGNAQRKVREQVMASGAVGFLAKPVDMESFNAELTRLGMA